MQSINSVSISYFNDELNVFPGCVRSLLHAAYEWHNNISCELLMFVVALEMTFVDIQQVGGLPIKMIT